MSFSFKQFHVIDEHCAMKVGTDAVLLGAWASVGLPDGDVCHILDIGSGSGVIALMLAQRAPYAMVTALEIDVQATADLTENVAKSPFSDRVRAVNGNILNFFPDDGRKFLHIVSNPPYHEEELLPPSALRAKARHTAGGLTFEALILNAVRLLDFDHPDACFSVVLPSSACSKFCRLAEFHNLHLSRRTDVVTRPTKPCKRVLLEFSPFPCETKHDLLPLLGDGNLLRSQEYSELCADFYL